MSDRTHSFNNNPLIQAIHTAVKGRARFKVNGLYGSAALKKYLEFELLKEPKIKKAEANLLTGNILVIFSPYCQWSEIALQLEGFVLKYRKQVRIKTVEVTSFVCLGKEARKNPSKDRRKLGQLAGKAKQMSSSEREPKLDPWYLIEADSVLANFQTSKVSGLSRESARETLQNYGPNILPESACRSKLSILIEQFKSLPVALLTVAAACSVATGGIADAVVIMGVVAINAVIGYATESHSEKVIHSLKSLVKPSAFVLRDGIVAEISASEIVLGDILILKPGSYVAADARLIEAKCLSVDESALTGESMPVAKTTEALANPDVPLGDRVNMVYMGTLVTGGQGSAVVVATGKLTEMGKIQTLVGEAELPQTPMQKQLDQAGSQLVLISGAVCGVVFGIGLWRGYGVLEMLKTSISLAVAAVPEGLPTVATTTLALGIAKMRQHNVLIRRLDAVETLGSVQTICMDKTGTITANKMSVVEIYTDIQRIQVAEGQLIVNEKPLNPYENEELLKLIHVSVLCNESEVNGHQQGEYVVRGSATENALIYLAIASGVNVSDIREKYPLASIQHRSENQNFMSTLHLAYPHHNLVAVKGSPTEVLERCSWHLKDGEMIPLTETDRLAIEGENDRMAGKALRVLGLAYAHIEAESEGLPEQCAIASPDIDSQNHHLIWLGLIGMADPVRSGVTALMGDFHRAGIDTVMITGDQSPTAYAIGKELHLSNGEPLEIMDSTQLGNLDPDVMKALLRRVHVFARISPANKLQIVQALQSAGKVVAMTGDGINDAPALKAADVGVAMGHAGTDVAREVADVVLQDDNLETTIVAVSQGRTIYNNIRKSVHFLLSTNLSEIIVMLSATAVGIGQPLNAVQLLWLNLVTDIFPGLALAMEAPEPDVLSQPPRNPDEPIIKPSDFKRIIFESATISASSLGAYGYALMKYGIGPQASTIGFMSLTSAQLLHALSCRSDKHSLFSGKKLPPNRYLTVALGGSLTLQILAAVVPGLKGLLQIAPINLVDSAVIGTSALLPLLVNEGTKELTTTKTVKIQN